jgi:hypothetical protein
MWRADDMAMTLHSVLYTLEYSDGMSPSREGVDGLDPFEGEDGDDDD